MNPYADEHPELDLPGGAAVRRANLRHYLDERAGARLLLVGEAIGYRGGRFSGMAFTSERLLASWGPPYAAVVDARLGLGRAVVDDHPRRAGRP